MSHSHTNRYASPSTASKAQLVNVSKDIELSSPPEDSISALSWSGAGDILAVTSWDSTLRIYDVSNTLFGKPMAMIGFERSVLSCHWSSTGQCVVGAGTDRTAKLLDLGSNGGPAQQVAAHDSSISSVRFFEGPGNYDMVVTGSWDKSIRIWDLRTSSPVARVDVKDKVYSMDIQKKQLVVATAGKGFRVIHLDNPTKIYEEPRPTGLKGETRVVRCFPDGRGFAIGCAGGKGAIQWFDDMDSPKNFSFKCHREPAAGKTNATNVYAVNAVAFHPMYGTFLTGGSNGSMSIWDKDSKSRLCTFPTVGTPISASSFNRNGNILAYAISYDWSKGYAHNTPQTTNKIMVHLVDDAEVRPKNEK